MVMVCFGSGMWLVVVRGARGGLLCYRCSRHLSRVWREIHKNGGKILPTRGRNLAGKGELEWRETSKNGGKEAGACLRSLAIFG